jgi:HlyD family secretion protein
MLFEKGIDSPSAMDTAQATYRRSLAAVDSARAALSVQRARITQSSASLQTTQVDLGRTRIVSPITGVVVNRAIDPGQTVQASFQAPVLFQIAQDLSKLQVKILVDEADIGQVREGQAVKFSVDAFPDEVFWGQVTQVRKQPETQSNVVAYQVIAEAANPRGQLLPGMTANAEIQIERRANVLRVPVAALRFKPAEQRAAAAAGPGSPQALAAELRAANDPQARERLYDQLGLSADQKAKARAIDQDTKSKMIGAIGNGAAMRRLIEDGRTRFEALLTPQQKAMNDVITGRNIGQRRSAQVGVVYVLADGRPRAVLVRIGASDGSNTEVSGDLKVGDEVIVGGGPQPKVQFGGPPRR